jgi:hypothetical protein
MFADPSRFPPRQACSIRRFSGNVPLVFRHSQRIFITWLSKGVIFFSTKLTKGEPDGGPRVILTDEVSYYLNSTVRGLC